jgi:hypothetical protein
MCCEDVFNVPLKRILKKHFPFSQSYKLIDIKHVGMIRIKIDFSQIEKLLSKKVFSITENYTRSVVLLRSHSIIDNVSLLKKSRKIILRNGFKRTIKTLDEGVQLFFSIDCNFTVGYIKSNKTKIYE